MSLTVKEIDGSPTLTNITTIEVTNTSLSQPAVGTARITIPESTPAEKLYLNENFT